MKWVGIFQVGIFCAGNFRGGGNFPGESLMGGNFPGENFNSFPDSFNSSDSSNREFDFCLPYNSINIATLSLQLQI